jgi:type 2 lantibiotic biosynthesis protein LanM
MAAAEAVGQRLDALALHDGEDVSWIGFTQTAQGRWNLSPLGLDVYDGLPGVTLFLAHLGALTRQERYTTLAREAAGTMRRRLTSSPPNDLSIGAFEGLGGLVYVFVQLGMLWDDLELLHEARLTAERLRALIRYDRKFDIIGGAAGAIMGCLALHDAAPCEDVLAVAVECGEHLLRHARPLRGGLAWPPYFSAEGPLTGLAHGASGVGWALLELSAASSEARYRDAALATFDYERALFSAERKNWPDLRRAGGADGGSFMVGWCHGAPGIALARLRALKHVDGPALRGDIAAGLGTTVRAGFRGDHSLCHGSLGNIEPLIQAYGSLDAHPWSDHVGRLAAAILRSIRHDGWICGVPLGVETPGLMTGLAGIGYGLLRLAEPSTTPSVLALAAPPRQWPRGAAQGGTSTDWTHGRRA